SAGDQQPRRAARAPAAADGADAVAAAEPQPRSPRGAAADDGRAPAGRFAAARAGAAVGLHAGDDAAVGAQRALSVLRRRPTEHGRGDGPDGAAPSGPSPRSEEHTSELQSL